MSSYLTPTRGEIITSDIMQSSSSAGLGCYSGSQLLYAMLSTVTWLFSAMSGMLTHNFAASPRPTSLQRVTGRLSIVLRQTAKVVAALNTAWIFVSSFFQFSNLDNRCYCNTVAFGLGGKSYGALVETAEQLEVAKSYWVGGIAVASGVALIFVIIINVLMKRPQLGASQRR
jgi:hypothetical protein